jgi:hypothetical protein
VAAALEGKLTEKDAATLMSWVRVGHPYAGLRGDGASSGNVQQRHPYARFILELVATTPGEGSEDLVLTYMDEIEPYVNAGEFRKEWARAIVGLLRRPGLGTSGKLAARLSSYEDYAWRNVRFNLLKKWSEDPAGAPAGSIEGRESSSEEEAFVQSLLERIEETKEMGE